MEFVLICFVAFAASWLTLISGFGLGTLLLPTFILFFSPLEAVAMTAIVHFLNNVFKFSLLFKQVNRYVALWFGVSGIVGAAVGAWVSTNVEKSIAYTSPLDGISEVSWFSFLVGLLMIVFALQELLLGKVGFAFSKKAMVPGGVLSGFFGGLTGHQGALRSMFLLKSGLTAQAYVATGTAIALMVDLTRIPIYLGRISKGGIDKHTLLIASATLFAFIGAFIGKRMIEKITYTTVQWVVGVLMIVVGLLLLLGLL
ncbi:sulfite exporter TauE/SafE family protein [Phaeocystidibacter marisrubri]|uniref:Probable membrane transporter protein n=1 Tax=Phaeocystidibacter marisrubri TaxID=1577780 RepID=A0A6L3ZKH3_9FLAO|nr:sulfite exporter TauE/SafE family protein [Phaeocystidibacter marisrubri]KAB2817955.1 sulfite exporter TauE/SafE family protein [Phaeocystidibacter marisrubri]GGH72686.1 hypothetical protein GCM10011318_16900 [Phaeocystidibacter marisrubri]